MTLLLAGHHISGSAPMGNCSNPFAVTDGKGRVHKVDGLRVIDASLFPSKLSLFFFIYVIIIIIILLPLPFC